jgi:hypothetical protein
MNEHPFGDFEDDAITEVIPYVDDLMRAKHAAQVAGHWPLSLCQRCGGTEAEHSVNRHHCFE